MENNFIVGNYFPWLPTLKIFFYQSRFYFSGIFQKVFEIEFDEMERRKLL